MAHELDRRSDGTGAMFSVRATPWHREGTLLSDAPSLEDALRLGGLDFNVEVRPLYTRSRPTPELPDVFTYERAGDAFAIVRTVELSPFGGRLTAFETSGRVIHALLRRAACGSLAAAACG